MGVQRDSLRALGNMNPELWYLDGVAYDFTEFANRHPGGKYAIYLGKGRECNSLFQSYHLVVPPKELLDKYRCPADMQLKNPTTDMFEPAQKFTFNKGDFYDTVKQEAIKYFRERNIDWKCDPLHGFYMVVNFISIFFTLYKLSTVALGSTMGSVTLEAFVWAIAFGFARALLVVQTVHAASHHAVSRKPWVNRWAYRLGTIVIGLWSPANWDLQHLVAHHVYTNQWPWDSDSGFPIKSIGTNQRRYWYHKYQHIYSWVLYAFFIPIIMLNALRELVSGRQHLFRMKFYWTTAKYESWVCITGMYLFLTVQFWFQPFMPIFALTLASNLFASLFFSLQFVVNHEVDSIFEENKVYKELPTRDWGAYQLEESADFAAHSQLSLELSGGLNTQIEHHLFPSVHYAHYKNLSKIVQRVAKKFGVRYISAPSIFDAWRAHYNLLKNPPTTVRSKKASSEDKKVL